MTTSGQKGHRDPEPPAGWEPEHDREAHWQAITELLRRADQPPQVPPARFEAMRLELERTLRAEGLIASGNPGRHHHDGFRAWLSTVFFGGGPGGQVVRLGVAAGLALFLGLQIGNIRQDAGETAGPPLVAEDVRATAPDDSMLAARTEEVLRTPPRAELQPQPGTVAIPDQEPPIMQQVRTRTEGPGVAIGGAPVTARDGNGSRTIPRSHLAELEERSLWQETVPNAQAWVFELPRPRSEPVLGTMTPVSQGTYGDQRVRLASEALDQLQVLKFYSLVNRDDQSLQEVRRIESLLTDLAAQTEWDARPKTSVMEAFRKAEASLAAQRYHEAQQSFEEVTFIAPGSAHAFLAHFQIGRIALEHTQDYDLALESFRRCLEEYPSSVMSGQHRRYLMDRVMVLTETEEEGWQSLGWWQASEQAQDPREAARLLQQVVRESSSDRLASDAATRLKDIVLADVALQRVNAVEIAEAIRDRVARTKSSHDAARIQYAVAEMLARGTTDTQEAAREYRRVLELTPDDQTRRLASNRLVQLGALAGPE